MTGSYQDSEELLKEMGNFHFEKTKEKNQELAPEDFPVCILCRSKAHCKWEEADEGKLWLRKRKTFLRLKDDDNERGYLFEEVTHLSQKVISRG